MPTPAFPRLCARRRPKSEGKVSLAATAFRTSRLVTETANRGYAFLIPAAFPLKKSPTARAAPAENAFVFWAREA
jgi:hypothetical protein